MDEERNFLLKPPIVTANDEIEQLKRNIFRPDMEKLRLFTRMLRNNAMLKKARFYHKEK